jgi:hypothetical protein
MGVRPGFVQRDAKGRTGFWCDRTAFIITGIRVMNILVRSDLLSSGELYSAVLSKQS